MFESELRHISDNEIIAFVKIILNNAPQKFYTMPASSGGRYHPVTSQVIGGLINHTKQVFYIAQTILDTRLPIFRGNRDVVLASCLLHDIYKYDEHPDNQWTIRNHAIKAVEWIKQLPDVQEFFSCYIEKPDWYYEILDCIQSHNGVFSKEYQGEFNVNQSIVHLADYIASRKWNLFDNGQI